MKKVFFTSAVFNFAAHKHRLDGADRLKTVFSRLKYPKYLVNNTIKRFVDSKVCD